MKVGTSYLKMLIKLPFSTNHCYLESEARRLTFPQHAKHMQGLKSQGKYLSGAIGL